MILIGHQNYKKTHYFFNVWSTTDVYICWWSCIDVFCDIPYFPLLLTSGRWPSISRFCSCKNAVSRFNFYKLYFKMNSPWQKHTISMYNHWTEDWKYSTIRKYFPWKSIRWNCHKIRGNSDQIIFCRSFEFLKNMDLFTAM